MGVVICPNCEEGAMRKVRIEASWITAETYICPKCGWTPVCFYCKQGGGGVDVELLEKKFGG